MIVRLFIHLKIRNHEKFNFPIFLFSYLLICFSFTSQIIGQSVDSLRIKTEEVFLPSFPGSDDINVLIKILTAQNPDGSWALNLANNGIDLIDYYDNSRSGWEPIEHLERLLEMSEAYALEVPLGAGYPSSQDTLISHITSGLSFWYDSLPAQSTCSTIADDCPCAEQCPCSKNWWWNRIGKQRELQRIGVLLYDKLAVDYPDLLAHIIDDLPEDTYVCTNEIGEDDVYTGENKIEVAGSMIVRGILENDSVFVRKAVDSMAVVLQLTAAEGIQHDFSFHQHQEVIYNGGYGITLIERVSEWGVILNNSPFDFDSDSKNTFFEFILEGCRWMLRGNTKDYSVNGRNIARQWPNNNAAIDGDVMELIIEMAEGNTGLVSTLTTMMDQANNDLPQGISGNKHFWRSDYVAHHETHYFSSVKMCSDRTIGTESLNRENKLGYWLPFGCTYIYRDGSEYRNIFPYWDWTKIPGVTSPDYVPEFDHPEGKTLRNTQSELFVGSTNNPEENNLVNQGSYSVTTMIYNKNYDNNPDSNWIWVSGDDYDDAPNNINEVNISAKKAWFHFGDEVIALGAGISSTDETNSILTTINQTHLNGTVTYSGGMLGQDETETVSTDWIEHNSVAYIFPGGEDLHLSSVEQSGDWGHIGKGSGAESGYVFKAWIDHGLEPTDSTYVYIAVPDQDGAIYAANNPVSVLENTNTIQAVRKVESDEDVLLGVVYYPGFDINDAEVALTPEISLSASHPCALLYDGNIGQVCVSSPDRTESEVAVYISETIGTTEKIDTVSFTLPSGNLEGTSECKNIFSVIKGRVITHCAGGDGIAGVEILPSGVFTDTEGNFTITEFIPGSGGGYKLTPFKDNNYIDGVNGEDITKILDYTSGDSLLTDFEKIAADVVYSGVIDKADVAEIQALIDEGIATFLEVDSWRFVNSTTVFPISPNFPQSITVNLEDPNQNINFIGIKMGDVNCSSTNQLVDTCVNEINILIKDRAVRKDELFTVGVQTENFKDVEVYQFSLHFDKEKLKYKELKDGDLNRGAKTDYFNLSTANDGIINTVWLQNDASNAYNIVLDTTLADSSSLFLIEFEALEDISSLSNLLGLGQEEDLLPRAWSSGNDCGHIMNLQFLPSSLGANVNSEELILSGVAGHIHVYPNPTERELIFKISTEIANEHTIQIYNTIGKEVLIKKVDLDRGDNSVRLKDIVKWEDGLYYFTVTDSSGVSTSGNFVKQ